MNTEEKIIQVLESRYAYLKGSIRFARPRRLFLDVNLDKLFEVLEFLLKDLEFKQLCTITGLDEGSKFAIMYHFAQNSGGIVLNLKTTVDRNNPTIKSITTLYESAEIYERELEDLFGMVVEGLPKGLRYPLPDDWPKGDFPLRKDWKAKKE
jgi:membrane-bound hydrogenase subunit beta